VKAAKSSADKIMQILPFRPDHIHELADFGGQEWARILTGPEQLERLLSGPAFSGAISGQIVGSAGIGSLSGRRGYAWAVLSEQATQHPVPVHRAARRFLHSADCASQFSRVEAYVDPAFVAAVRWVTALGFQCETPEPMQKFFPNGGPALMFAYFPGE
jgi:hypothetical protein